jgi:hypothetical protein
MSEFTNFDAEKSETWTLLMAAAWFIWRSYEAVQDQWKVATGEWKPASDPPSPILAMTRRHPGMLACVFNQAGFDNGGSWDDPWTEELSDAEYAVADTEDPYGRLKFALRSGKLSGTWVFLGGRRTRHLLLKDDWVDFDQLARPPTGSRPASYSRIGVRGWNDELVLVSRKQVIAVEAEISKSELNRPVWNLPQVLGWIAYQGEERFRSLGRIDLPPPKFFDHGYEPDYAVRDPLDV